MGNCDLCKENGKDVKAKYDAKTTFGPWAFLCEDCFQKYSECATRGRQIPENGKIIGVMSTLKD